MKISTEIIFNCLVQKMQVQRFGPIKEELVLNRIEFYVKNRLLKRNCIYLVRSDQLSDDLNITPDVSFICVGGKPPQAYMTGKCSFLLLESCNDILSIFNEVQEIFELYEAWDNELQQLLATTADIREMIKISLPIFENPIYITDHNLNLLASTVIEEDSGKLSIDYSDAEWTIAQIIKNPAQRKGFRLSRAKRGNAF